MNAMDKRPTPTPKKTALAWFLGLNGLFLLLAALLGLWLTRKMGQGGINAVDEWLEQIGPWLMGIRLSLMAALIGLWPPGMKLLAKRHGWPQPRQAFMLGLRGRVALWLLAAEVALAHNGLAVLTQFISTP